MKRFDNLKVKEEWIREDEWEPKGKEWMRNNEQDPHKKNGLEKDEWNLVITFRFLGNALDCHFYVLWPSFRNLLLGSLAIT